MFNLFKTINIQNKNKENKFVKEGLEDIKLNLILQNINEYANKKRYEQNVNEGLNLLIVEHLFLEMSFTKSLIHFIIFHLNLIKNEFNKLKSFVGKEKVNEEDSNDITKWFDIVNLPKQKTIKNDYPSVSQKSYNIIENINKKTYSRFYTLLSKLKLETDFDFTKLKNIFKDQFIENILTLLNKFQIKL